MLSSSNVILRADRHSYGSKVLHHPIFFRTLYNMHMLILVIVAGGIGSALRYLTMIELSKLWAHPFPIATLTVNLVGCILIGLCNTLVLETTFLSRHSGIALSMGLLGGFTTFSAFGFETFMMFERQEYGWALSYVFGSLLGGLGGVGLGRYAARALTFHVTGS